MWLWIGGAPFYHHLFSCTLANVKSKSVYLDCSGQNEVSSLPMGFLSGWQRLADLHSTRNCDSWRASTEWGFWLLSSLQDKLQRLANTKDTLAPELTLRVDSVKTWSISSESRLKMFLFDHFQIILKLMVSPGLCLIYPILIHYPSLANKSSLVIPFPIHGWEAERKENKIGRPFELNSVLQTNWASTNGQVFCLVLEIKGLRRTDLNDEQLAQNTTRVHKIWESHSTQTWWGWGRIREGFLEEVTAILRPRDWTRVTQANGWEGDKDIVWR